MDIYSSHKQSERELTLAVNDPRNLGLSWNSFGIFDVVNSLLFRPGHMQHKYSSCKPNPHTYYKYLITLFWNGYICKLPFYELPIVSLYTANKYCFLCWQTWTCVYSLFQQPVTTQYIFYYHTILSHGL